MRRHSLRATRYVRRHPCADQSRDHESPRERHVRLRGRDQRAALGTFAEKCERGWRLSQPRESHDTPSTRTTKFLESDQLPRLPAVFPGGTPQGPRGGRREHRLPCDTGRMVRPPERSRTYRGMNTTYRARLPAQNFGVPLRQGPCPGGRPVAPGSPTPRPARSVAAACALRHASGRGASPASMSASKVRMRKVAICARVSTTAGE